MHRMDGRPLNTRIVNREVKVCPVVIRGVGGQRELLLFEHPLAGVQLAKGTMELTDRSIESAALRELKEESGIFSVSATEYLGSWESGYQNQLWHFVHCDLSVILPDHWTFFAQDDGGHEFRFFWHQIGVPITFNCHKIFLDAIEQIELYVLSNRC